MNGLALSKVVELVGRFLKMFGISKSDITILVSHFLSVVGCADILASTMDTMRMKHLPQMPRRVTTRLNRKEKRCFALVIGKPGHQ